MVHLSQPKEMQKARKASFWTVDLFLLPIKIHYFIFFAALACALPFRTVFAKQLGVSATAVGIIFSAVPFMKILTNPMFGFILDYFKRFRLTICVVIVCVALSHIALVFIPPIRQQNVKIPTNITRRLEARFVFNCLQNSSNAETTAYIELYHFGNLNCDKKNSFSYDLQCSYCKVNESVRTDNEINRFKCIPGCSKLDKYFNLNFRMNFKHDSLTFRNNDYEIGNQSHISIPINLEIPLIKEVQTTNFQKLIEQRNTNLKYQREQYSMSFDNVRDLCTNCPWNDYLECQADMSLSHTRDCLSESSRKHAHVLNDFFFIQFWILFLLMALSSVSFSAVLFLMDAVCYEMLDDNRERYGAQRLWGTVGWGLGALAGGLLNQTISGDSKDIDYAPSFYLLAALTVLDLVPLSKVELTNVKYSPHICKDVGSLLCKFQTAVYVVMVLGVGVLSGLIWNYQFWFMEEIGASQTLLGLSQTFECLFAELPCFVISGWIIRKIGHIHCLSITFLCFGLRYLCFAYMKDPWWSLPAGLLHGPTFGVFFASMTMYAKSEAAAGTEASVQSFFALAFEGIGVGTGSILGGLGFDAIGSRQTFMYAAIASFVLLVINIILTFVLKIKDHSIKDTEMKLATVVAVVK